MFKTGKIKDLQNRISELESEIHLAIQFVNSIKQNEKQVEYLSALKQKQTLLSNALLDMYEQMYKLSEQEEQRNWAIRGSAKFGEILRANQDNLKTLAQAIISNLVKFLEGVQGGFFLLNENEAKKPYLELMACYAYERRKYQQKIIPIDKEFAEGLIGQTFLEKETLVLNNLPENYTYIKSGLGETIPKNLVIIPLKLNDVIYGVIELVSLKTFLAYEIDFLEKLAESISSSIANVKINETTKKLLEETQQQVEALKAQEEEMR